MGYQRNTVYVMLVLEKEQIRYACPNFSKFPILLLLLRLFIEPYVIVHGQQKKKPICICVKNCCYWRTHYNRIPVLRIFYFRIIDSEFSNDFNIIVLFKQKKAHDIIWKYNRKYLIQVVAMTIVRLNILKYKFSKIRSCDYVW